jgi:hypothetical protein
MGSMESDASNNSFIVACVFVAAGTCLSSYFLGTIRDTHADIQLSLDKTAPMRPAIPLLLPVYLLQREDVHRAVT